MFGIRFSTTPGQFVLPQGATTTRSFDDRDCVTEYVADKLRLAEHRRWLRELREEETGEPEPEAEV